MVTLLRHKINEKKISGTHLFPHKTSSLVTSATLRRVVISIPFRNINASIDSRAKTTIKETAIRATAGDIKMAATTSTIGISIKKEEGAAVVAVASSAAAVAGSSPLPGIKKEEQVNDVLVKPEIEDSKTPVPGPEFDERDIAAVSFFFYRFSNSPSLFVSSKQNQTKTKTKTKPKTTTKNRSAPSSSSGTTATTASSPGGATLTPSSPRRRRRRKELDEAN